MNLERIGPYRIVRKIGEGGMGVVYAAHDDRLERPVAIKLIRPEALADETSRERFRREARAAARVSHPNICLLYEFNEEAGRPYLVMELLEGEPLAARLARGPMAVPEAMALAEKILDALGALHRRRIIHRDLKPANVFLTPDGPKLLDFGLAHTDLSTVAVTAEYALTAQGMIVGTPQYMAPEQLFGRPVDERADLFAAALVFYEMLSGQPAFTGQSLAEIVHAVGYDQPPPLNLGPAFRSIEQVLQRALEKNPEDRPAHAEAFAGELRAALAPSTARSSATMRRTLTRFVALPLRVLRPDPDTDFLAFSVPDAVSMALAGLESMIVRSPQAVSAAADVRAVARDLAVDVVLSGTILRAGPNVRVTAQLSDTSGTIVWSDVSQAPIADLFQLQDALTSRIVSALSLQLTARDQRALGSQAPGNAEAYELYMRANQLMTDWAHWQEARSLYERAVALDPNYAPAWAQLGRARRVIAKWGGPSGVGLLPQAEAAFRRALQIDPDLAMAHDLSAYVEVELGRAPEAMERLLRRAATRSHEAGVFGGLVTTCRYAGLYDASLAADARVRAIDPALRTSVAWTHFLLGDREAAIRTDTGSPAFTAMFSRMLLGQIPLDRLREAETAATSVGSRLGMRVYRFVFEGNVDEALKTVEELRTSGFADPEGWYLYGYMFARINAVEAALTMLNRAVTGGYGCFIPLSTDPVWQALGGRKEFDDLLGRSRRLVDDARARFMALNGPQVLNAPQSASRIEL